MSKLKKIIASVLTCCFVLSMMPSTFVGAQSIEPNDVDWIEVGEISEGVTNVFSAEYQDGEEKYSARYIPNNLYFAITPTSTGYQITFHNQGLDAISTINFTMTITTYEGAYVTSKTATLTNVKPGNTTYTWTIAKSATIQETITLAGTGYDGETFILNGSTVRYNFAGGQYGTMQALGGQRHHIPSSNALSTTGVLSTYKGACIRMLTSDHYRTASYGSSTSAINFRNQEIALINSGKFLGAQKLGLSDIQNVFGIKYDTALSEMVLYTFGLGFSQ